jgi:hypothetical protein
VPRDLFAESMVAALQAVLVQAPNVLTVTVDGLTVTYANPSELRDAYNFWSKRVSRANGSTPRASQIYLGGNH